MYIYIYSATQRTTFYTNARSLIKNFINQRMIWRLSQGQTLSCTTWIQLVCPKASMKGPGTPKKHHPHPQHRQVAQKHIAAREVCVDDVTTVDECHSWRPRYPRRRQLWRQRKTPLTSTGMTLNTTKTGIS